MQFRVGIWVMVGGRRFTGEMSICVDQSRHATGENVEDHLDQAVHKGKRDVVDLQATGAVLVGNAKEMAAKVTKLSVWILFFFVSTKQCCIRVGVPCF